MLLLLVSKCVSRLSSDTTCESVAAYISSKVSANVSVSKFNFAIAREIWKTGKNMEKLNLFKDTRYTQTNELIYF